MSVCPKCANQGVYLELNYNPEATAPHRRRCTCGVREILRWESVLDAENWLTIKPVYADAIKTQLSNKGT